MLRYQQYDIEARQLEYQFAAGGRLGRLWARGPGRASGTLPDKKDQSFEATWNDRVILQPDKGDHALSLLGGGLVRVHGEGEFAARDLHLWINESLDPQSPRGKPRYRYLPLRMLAEGDVRVDSWQLAGVVQRRGLDSPRSTRGPGRFCRRRKPPAAEAERDRRIGQKFELAAEHLQTQLVRRGSETLVEHLILDGRVQFREVRTEKAGDVPLAIAGNLVQVDHADTSLGRIVVQGRPAEVAARGMTVTGDNIQLNRGDNRIGIAGPGKMLLPAQARKRPGGTEPLAAPMPATPLNVAWAGRMDFDGRIARFLRDVQVSGSQQSQQGEIFDLLVMGHELTVTLNQEVNLSRDKAPENLDVQQVAVVGGAYLQNSGRLQGNRSSYDQLQVRDLTIDQSSGRLHAAGPGWGSSVRYDKGFAENRLNPAADASPAKPRLAYVRVDYEDEIEGNVQDREIEFRGRVRTLYGPVDDWEQTLDPDPAAGLGKGQYLLTSDRLAVADVGCAGEQPGRGHRIGCVGQRDHRRRRLFGPRLPCGLCQGQGTGHPGRRRASRRRVVAQGQQHARLRRPANPFLDHEPEHPSRRRPLPEPGRHRHAAGVAQTLVAVPVLFRPGTSTAADHGTLRFLVQQIQGTPHVRRATFHDVQVDHRRLNVLMSQQLLHPTDVLSAFQEVSREAVPIMPSSA